MGEENEFELIVSQGRRSIWALIIAALFFTISIIALIVIVWAFWNLGFDTVTLSSLATGIKVIAFSLSIAIPSAITKTVLIDTDKNKLISRYFIGAFSKDILSEVPSLEYISVFLVSEDCYQVNLWYKGNKHYNMYNFEAEKPAMKFAKEVALKLNIDLLDATEKGNSKWIETS